MTNCGGCLCGSVQYEITGQLKDVAYCHCSMCRRALGAAFAAYARVGEGSFLWLSGENFVTTYESSPGVGRCFCSKCGASLGVMGAANILSWVSLGTIAGDPGLLPEAHIFADSKAPWHEITDNLPCFDEWPPATSEFYQRFD